jgi:hypothetical protein
VKAHEKRLIFETLARIAAELEEAPTKAEKMSRDYARADAEKHPALAAERMLGHSGGRIYAMEVGALESRIEMAARELRALVLAFGPKRRARA